MASSKLWTFHLGLNELSLKNMLLDAKVNQATLIIDDLNLISVAVLNWI